MKPFNQAVGIGAGQAIEPEPTIMRTMQPYRIHRKPKSDGLVRVLIVSVLIFGGSSLLSSGCAGYRVGSQSLFRPDIHSVHVPIFQSDLFRRHYGERLTEAVVKEIEQRTHFKVTSGALAHSTLRGHILSDTKRVLAENVNDEPRDLQYGSRIELTWTDRRGNSLMRRVVLNIEEAVNFVPEGGQSMTTAQQELINRMARNVVSQMEMGW